MKYEIQTRIGNDWENCWTDEYPDGVAKPTTFDTYQEAQAELTNYLREQHEAVDDSHMLDKYDRSDFRIRPIE